MGKIAIVFWSGTGNTEAMADYVADGAKGAGAECEIIAADNFSADKIDDFDAIAFGCPSMGDEVLEETVFEPLFESCRAKLKGKKIGLFGSYGWGDGEWMRNWEDICRADGADLVSDGVICCEYPDDAAAEDCKALGAALTE